MTSASIVSGLAALAEAAYVDFGLVGPNGLEGPSLSERFPTSDPAKGWPPVRVLDFESQWRVVAHQPDTASGFSGTVFERISPQPGESRYVFALRGTAGTVDIVEDLGNLVANGMAWAQTLDMYNWWQELITPLGSTYQRASAVRVDDGVSTLPNVVAEPGQLWRIDLTATVQNHAPRLPTGVVLDVTGHSLGGHLATAFSRLFANSTANVVTINGAGYSVLGVPTGNIDRVFATLGGSASFPTDRVLNIYGDRGPEIVTQDLGLQQPGQHLPVALEDWNALTNTLGHGSAQMSLSLSLYETLRRLQEGTGTSMDAATMLNLFQASLRSGSNSQYEDYERLIDNLRFIVLGDTQRTATGDPVSFHERLINLRNSESYRSMEGRVTIATADSGLASDAKTDFGAFVSLLGLSPIVLSTGGNAAVTGALQAAHPDVYADWTADRSARLYGDEGYDYSYSEQWYADRTWMLGLMLARNEVDGNGHFTMRSLPQDVRLWDLGSGTKLYLNNSSNEGPATESYPKQQITFGTAQADFVEGGAYDDRLYGGGGLDQLNGGDGRDSLEGGAGFDSLYGEKGNDTLHGGADGDWLEGGEDHDVLIGGSGIDTYRFSGTFGRDTIVDSDGHGVLSFESGALSGGQRVAGGAAQWISSDGLTTFTLVPQSAGAQDLLITQRTAPGATTLSGTVTVRNWSNGQLGITLQDSAVPAPAPSTVNTGGFIKAFNPETGRYDIVGGNYVSAGADPLSQDLLLGDSSANELRGGGGNDALLGNPGDDVLYGDEGADMLLGGNGADRLFGGAGDDHIHGSGSFPGFAAPTHVTTPPPSAVGTEIARGFGWVVYDPPGVDGNGLNAIESNIFTAQVTADEGNYIEGGTGNDRISAGRGNDVVFGGDDNDTIEGMDGADILSGDAGDDRLEGDGGLLTDYLTYTPLNAHGDDILLGGAGNDTLVGQGGNDMLYGGSDNDRLWGDAEGNASTSPNAVPGSHHGDDFLDGGTGNDQLAGGGRHDEILGGEGDDIIFGDDEVTRLSGLHHGSDLVHAGAGNDQVLGGGGSDVLHGDAGDDVIWGDDPDLTDESLHGHDTLDGGDGNDSLYGNSGNDELRGGAGEDQLLGGNGDDILDGGSGSDLMDGGAGNDTYIVRAGEAPLTAAGQAEYIADSGGIDTIAFGALAVTDVSNVLASGSNLVLELGGSNRLVIADGLQGAVERFEFAGGDAASLDADRLIAERAQNTITSRDGSGVLLVRGGRSNDTIVVTEAMSRVAGGRGNDSISVQGSGNSYVFHSGDGVDQIAEGPAIGESSPVVSGASQLTLSGGITDNQVQLSHAAGSLVLNLGGGDQVHLGGFDRLNAQSTQFVGNVVFSGGPTLTLGELIGRGFDFYGTAGDDLSLGTSGVDRFHASLGNDEMSGGAGADTYFWTASQGQDRVADGDAAAAPIDVLDLSAAHAAADLSFSRAGADLVISLRGEAQGLTVVGQFNGDGNGVESIRFAGGQVWGRAEIAANLTLVLTNGADTVFGTAASEVIYAGGGNDRVLGNGGDDYIAGEDGADHLSGGEGDDTLVGGLGIDQLDGDQGNDTLIDGTAEDALFGGDGNDELRDGRSMWGGNGNDRYVVTRYAPGVVTTIYEPVTPAIDSDELELPALASGTSHLFLRGYNAETDGYDDLLIGPNDGSSGSIRVDRYFYDDAQRAGIETIRLADGTTLDRAAVLARIGGTTGTDGNDSLSGFRFDDTLDGGAGNDVIGGAAGNDLLLGGSGLDQIYGGSGQDVLDGGSGVDRLLGERGSDIYRWGRG